MNETELEDLLHNVTRDDPCPQKTLDTLWENGKLEIPLYSVIFLLAVVGNILVILTLAKNSRMRTNTNVFLLNLAVSDLVLAVLCMPFTLVGTLLKDFVFGEFTCKLVPYLQATSVAASVWTLVALSVERYYAICHPLRSRRWQTLSHAYHLIGFIWTGGAFFMLPIPILSQLQPTNKGHHKCREKWPDGGYERAYNLFLDFLLLVIPLLALAVTYYLIAVTLWRDCAKRPSKGGGKRDASENVPDDENPAARKSEINHSFSNGNGKRKILTSFGCFKTGREKEKCDSETGEVSGTETEGIYVVRATPSSENSGNEFLEVPKPMTKFLVADRDWEIDLRRTNYERSLTNKRRVIKMLFVVVLEFFISWTPLYVINTLALFWPQLVYETVGYKTISFCHLLAYTSGCCNPITYCFMNKSFRTSFIDLFGWHKTK